MRTILISVAIVTSAIFFFAFTGNDEKDYNQCVIKHRSTWGKPCPECTYNNDIFQVTLKNTCTENVDVLIAVQEVNKTWKCLLKENLAPNDTMVGHACKGTGKYLKWARKAGDTELVFPTCDEINATYKN